MADAVQNLIGIDQHVAAMAAGIDSIRWGSAKRTRFLHRVGEWLLALVVPPEVAVRASEQYALLPPEVRARYEW